MDTEQRIKEYVDHYSTLLELVQQMWHDPLVQCYNDETLPSDRNRKPSVFLAGPTSRNFHLSFNWRCMAVDYLRAAGFEGWIYIPEPRGMEHEGDFTERGYIHDWESSRLLSTSHKVFWVPRDHGELLGLNTNHEWGVINGLMIAGQRPSVFVGWPPDAARMGLPRHYTIDLAKHGPIYDDLETMCKAVAAAH